MFIPHCYISSDVCSDIQPHNMEDIKASLVSNYSFLMIQDLSPLLRVVEDTSNSLIIYELICGRRRKLL